MHEKSGTTANTGSTWAWHLDRTYSKTHYAHGDGANVSEERQDGEFTKWKLLDSIWEVRNYRQNVVHK
jgi:hypothetical protein